MCNGSQMGAEPTSSREQADIAKEINTFNQISQSAVYKRDDKSVTLSVCGGSYGGGSECLIVTKRPCLP